MTSLRGVDISSWQEPAKLDYEKLAGQCQFVMVRLTYGTHPDRHALEHCRRSHEVALQVGGYGFFRPTEDPHAQADAFADVAAAAGLGPGSIVPGFDVEKDGELEPSPQWSYPASVFAADLLARYGGTLAYLSEQTWIMLGRPDWVLERDLWTPHWNVAKPRTPGGKPCRIWQHAVAPIPGVYPGPLDQDVAEEALPTIAFPDTERPPTMPEPPVDGIRRERDEELQPMSKLHESLKPDGSHYSWFFYCPACNAPHQCDTRWPFNGSVDRPTFTGSVLVYPVPKIGRPLCHSYVTDGRIRYLTDCGHAMAGKEVELPEWRGFYPDEPKTDPCPPPDAEVMHPDCPATLRGGVHPNAADDPPADDGCNESPTGFSTDPSELAP